MTIYLLLIALVSINGLLFIKLCPNKKLFLIFSFLAMGLVMGLRGPKVGEDTKMYINVAESMKHISWSSIISEFPKSTWSVDIYGYHKKMETVYLLFVKTIMSFTAYPQWVLVICAIITCAGFAKFIYNSSLDVFMSTYVFMCGSAFMFAFNGMRQCMAIAIAINSYTYIKDKKMFKAILTILIAFLFHQTAIIYLTLILLSFIKYDRKSIKYVIIAAIAIPFSAPVFRTIISDYYSTYLQINFWGRQINGIILLWIFELVLVVYIIRRANRFTSIHTNPKVLYSLTRLYEEHLDEMQGTGQEFKEVQINEVYLVSSIIILYFGFEVLGFQYTAVQRVAFFFNVFFILFFPIAVQLVQNRTKTIISLMIYGILTAEYFSYAMSDARKYIFFWQG